MMRCKSPQSGDVRLCCHDSRKTTSCVSGNGRFGGVSTVAPCCRRGSRDINPPAQHFELLRAQGQCSRSAIPPIALDNEEPSANHGGTAQPCSLWSSRTPMAICFVSFNARSISRLNEDRTV